MLSSSPRKHGDETHVTRARRGDHKRDRDDDKTQTLSFPKGWTDVRTAVPEGRGDRARGRPGAQPRGMLHEERRLGHGRQRQGHHHGRLPAGRRPEGAACRTGTTDVAEFEKQNPDITIKSVSVGEQCNNPPDFTARLAGGTMTDVFYGYMTDLQQVLDSGQAMDITQYVNKDTIPTWDSVDPALKEVFTDGGKLYAIPTKNYSMGLVYNKALFQQGRARRRTTRRRPGPRSGPRPRRSRRSATASPATRSTAPATPAAGTSPPSSTRRAARS